MDIQYNVLPKSIGKGSFGQVYIGIHKITGQLYAVKVEDKKSKQHMLKTESTIIQDAKLYQASTGPLSKGIINSYFFWEDKVNYYMVTDLLGPSIGKLHTYAGCHSV